MVWIFMHQSYRYSKLDARTPDDCINDSNGVHDLKYTISERWLDSFLPVDSMVTIRIVSTVTLILFVKYVTAHFKPWSVSLKIICFQV